MTQPKVTCAEYRSERRLFSLRTQLQKEDLPPEERLRLQKEIEDLEKCLGMD